MTFLLAAALAGAAKLPPDAPVYAALKPAQLADDVTFLNLAARAEPSVARAEDELRDLLHFDPFKKADWVRIGIDPESPVVMALGRSDPVQVEKALATLEKGQKTAEPNFSHRIVARVADATKLRTFLGDLARTPFGKSIKSTIASDQLILDLGKPPKQVGFDPTRSAARLLGEGALSFYLPLERMPALGTATGAAALARALQGANPKQRKIFGKQGAMEARSCKEWTQTGGALFDDFGAWVRLGAGAWEVHAAWGENALGKIALAMAAADDGLLDPAAVADAMLVGQLYLNGTALLRDVQRMGVMRDAAYAEEHIRMCGGAALLIAGLRYWPQGLAFGLDEIARDPEIGPFVLAARNVALVIRNIKNARFELEGAVAASMDLAPGGAAEKKLCAESRKLKRDGREVTVCRGHGKERVVWDVLPGGQRSAAVLPDEKTVDWWLGLRRPAKPSPTAPPLATLRVDLAKLMAQALHDQDPMIKAAVSMFAAGRTRAVGSIYPDGNLLRVDLRVDSAR
jgi:hypothetical protein